MVLVAPDSFKGTLTAAEVARALADGIRRGGGEAVELPIGDGGEGTMDALVATLGGELREAPASDPLGRPLTARFALLPDGGGMTAVVGLGWDRVTALMRRAGVADVDVANDNGPRREVPLPPLGTALGAVDGGPA